VLDVRPTDEYAAGHIPGALNVTLADLTRIIPALDLDVEVVAYCRGPHCIYTKQAVAALQARAERAANGGGLPKSAVSASCRLFRPPFFVAAITRVAHTLIH